MTAVGQARQSLVRTLAHKHFQRVRAQIVTRKNVFAGANDHFQRVRAQKVMRTRQ